MSLGRLNIQTAGYFVLQDFDVNDLFGVAYDETAATPKVRPVNHGARYTTVLDADGVPRFRRVAGTSGPLSGWICLPPKAPRILAQWAQVVPAKITTSALALKATPVDTGDGTGWTPATTLGEIVCYTSDGSMPPVGTFGLLVLGTELDDQNPLFFAGSSGTGLKTYKITVNSTGGIYTLQEYDHKGGATVGSAVAGCEELNLSPNVPVNHWVFGKVEADGVVRFDAPFGSC